MPSYHHSSRGLFRNRKAAALIVLAMAGVLLSGCSAGAQSSTPSFEAPELISRQAAPAGDVEEIKWNLSLGEPDTLDPRGAGTYSAGQVVSNLCEPLLTVDENFEVSPNLADYEQVSPTEILFTLRSDATFWDGSPVTAEDVAFSLERSMDPLAMVSYVFANVSSVEVSGPQSVTVRFSTPDTLFIPEMSTIAGAVVQQAFAESAGDAFGTAGIGVMCSGPFSLVGWEPGSSIVLERNDAYWNPDRQPFAQRIDFSFITDATALAQALEAGEIDGAYELPAATFASLQAAENGSLNFGPSTQSLQLYVAGPSGPMADADLRQAFQHLIDREGIAQAVYRGAADPLYAFITPVTWPAGTSGVYQSAYDELTASRGFDIDAAKSLVESSGYAGEELVIGIAAGDATQSQVAQLVQERAAAAGVQVSISALQPLTYAQATYDPAAREGLDFLLMQSFNAVQDPLEPAGFTFLPEAFFNFTRFDDPAVTEALTTARQTFDAAEQAEVFVRAQTDYEAANATVPILGLHTVSFVNDRLTGAITSFAYWTTPQMAFIGAAQ